MRILGGTCLAVLLLISCPRADAHGGGFGGHGGGWGGHCGGWGGHCGCWGGHCCGWGWGYRGCGWGPFVGGAALGLGLGLGLGYYGGYYGGYYPYYPYPYYPAYAVPPTVIVQSSPAESAVYSPQSPPAAPAQSPEQLTPPRPLPPAETPPASSGGVTQALATGSAARGRPVDVNTLFRQAHSPQEQERADALVELGRQKVERAVGPLVHALNSDDSPRVREAAARGLGLIGARWSLGALEHAARSDPDPEVRRSAGFAAQVIRGSSRP
jgi:hypothetical protein